MEMSGQFHALAALSPDKNCSHCLGGWVSPRGVINVLDKRNISCPCRDSNAESSVP
jgi:hypothetical protein